MILQVLGYMWVSNLEISPTFTAHWCPNFAISCYSQHIQAWFSDKRSRSYINSYQCGLVYATYHLSREPGNSIKYRKNSSKSSHLKISFSHHRIAIIGSLSVGTVLVTTPRNCSPSPALSDSEWSDPSVPQFFVGLDWWIGWLVGWLIDWMNWF